MKKQKKFIVLLLIFFTIVLSSCQVFATDYTSKLVKIGLSQEFLEYLELSDEERAEILMPRPFYIQKTKMTVTNPLKLTNMLKSSLASKYSLNTVIPENMVIKNQQNTGSCWAFAGVAALESTLALKNYKNGNNTIVYDFSERHMEYATSKTFLNNEINENGFNREVGSGGSVWLSRPYLTNGTGAIAESEMPFENNESPININEIQNKKVISQVNDTIPFPSYKVSEDTTLIKEQMKQHIMTYGGIDAGIHGASIFNEECYNNETGAIYCDNSVRYPINHAVLIVGWDDDYSKENFVESKRPKNNGAWIIKNSWGTENRYTLSEMKEIVFQSNRDQCISNGWTSAEQIPDNVAIKMFKDSGYTIDENNVATLKIGDNGFMYISYEDVNIYQDLHGILNAQDSVSYQNIYQYDKYGANDVFGLNSSKGYIAQVFNKKTSGNEYLTEVAIYAPETYTCKVYVNPNGTSKAKSNLQQVRLKNGESETFDAGYHTIEFLEPMQITGNNFVVVIEVQGTQSQIAISQEVNLKTYGYSTIFDNVVLENGKCFVSADENLAEQSWIETSKLHEISQGQLYNGDTTIKAFTTSDSDVLESIQITTPPTKTKYMQGENFDKTGMVVKAKYGDGKTEEITDYNITNGTNLQVGQTSVTISYKDKTTTQAIEVSGNSVESIAIITPPTKTQYYAGEDFDATGMIVQATYKDGTTSEVTDYTIKDGKNLKNGQTTVTIAFEEKETTQQISVEANPVEKIEIKQAPNKVKYVVGQNFDPEGMIVEATYENGMVKNVEDYTIQDGTNLQEGQTTVTIEYEEKTVTQAITVEVKNVTSISIKTMPTKTEYIQNKETLDLTGGKIEITYNDDSKEELLMTSEEINVSGFNNKQLGKQTITLTYKEKTAQFDIIIKEEAKPKNSNFDNMQGNVKRIRAYYYTEPNKEDYTVINVEISNIIKVTENEKMEYYYYLSSNQKETSIENWVKIDQIQQSDDKLTFEINTSDLSNYQEVADSNVLYLYIKEVATRNNMKSELITPSVLLEVGDVSIEEYVDGEKKDEIGPGETEEPTPGEKDDSTVSPEKIPYAGKSILMICLIFVIFVIGKIAYSRYKDIQLK